jgi:hypothetical protein
MELVQILLELLIAKLVADLKFPILSCRFLNCVIRQVNVAILQIVQRKFATARAKVSILVEISLSIPVNTCYQCKTANIEFPFVDEKWVADVLLNYVGSFWVWFGFDRCLNLIQATEYLYSISTVATLARLNNPNLIFIISSEEILPGCISQAFDMEGYWNNVEHIEFLRNVVRAEVLK